MTDASAREDLLAFCERTPAFVLILTGQRENAEDPGTEKADAGLA